MKKTENGLKILHVVSGNLSGGAARGAYWLNLALLQQGVDSKIFTNSPTTYNDTSVISINTSIIDKIFNFVRVFFDRGLSFLYLKRKKAIFSCGLGGVNVSKYKIFKEADVIHLHWINSGLINIKYLLELNKPVVWTMRDMWPFTGGCHYSMNCKNYETGCGNCEQLGSTLSMDLSRYVVSRKQKYISKTINLVCISSWLKECAQKSYLFKDYPIKTIANNIDTQKFIPIAKNQARHALGIPLNKKVILTAAQNLADAYKGFKLLLNAYGQISNDYYLLFFGKIDHATIAGLSQECKSLGFIDDNQLICLAYSSADVFVSASLMEAFGKTLAEAMSCGTPVVCFDCGGPKDIVSHKIDGYKAKPKNTQDLVQGVEWVLSHKNYDKLCGNARKKIVQKFDSKVVAKQYIDLYKNIMK